MNSIKQNQYRLKQILKNCQQEQIKLEQLKRQFKHQLNPKQKDNQFKKRKEKSSSLLKKTRIHIHAYQKAHFRPDSLQNSFVHLNRTQNCSPSQKRQTRHQQKSSKLQLTQKEFNPIINKQTDDDYEQKNQKKYCLPRINSIYCQHYSPKNASLSQHAMGQKMLRHSVHNKQIEKKKKVFNKQNVIKQHQKLKLKNQQKQDLYRINILKQICQQNVKKSLLRTKMNKQKKDILQIQEKIVSRSYLFDG